MVKQRKITRLEKTIDSSKQEEGFRISGGADVSTNTPIADEEGIV
jgi:hypothetical protein